MKDPILKAINSEKPDKSVLDRAKENMPKQRRNYKPWITAATTLVLVLAVALPLTFALMDGDDTQRSATSLLNSDKNVASAPNDTSNAIESAPSTVTEAASVGFYFDGMTKVTSAAGAAAAYTRADERVDIFRVNGIPTDIDLSYYGIPVGINSYYYSDGTKYVVYFAYPAGSYYRTEIFCTDLTRMVAILNNVKANS